MRLKSFLTDGPRWEGATGFRQKQPKPPPSLDSTEATTVSIASLVPPCARQKAASWKREVDKELFLRRGLQTFQTRPLPTAVPWYPLPSYIISFDSTIFGTVDPSDKPVAPWRPDLTARTRRSAILAAVPTDSASSTTSIHRSRLPCAIGWYRIYAPERQQPISWVMASPSNSFIFVAPSMRSECVALEISGMQAQRNALSNQRLKHFLVKYRPVIGSGKSGSRVKSSPAFSGSRRIMYRIQFPALRASARMLETKSFPVR